MISTRLVRDSSGLIMVEVALAVVVLAIGVLAVFSLFSSGLDLTRKTSADTQSVLFAEGVMASLRTQSAQSSGSTNWVSFWQDLADGKTNLPAPLSNDPKLIIRGDGVLVTNSFANNPLHDMTATNINHVLRSQMLIRLRNDDGFTNAAAVTLKVWEGKFGTTNDDDALILDTEFANAGTF